jgi:hypothetical protein
MTEIRLDCVDDSLVQDSCVSVEYVVYKGRFLWLLSENHDCPFVTVADTLYAANFIAESQIWRANWTEFGKSFFMYKFLEQQLDYITNYRLTPFSAFPLALTMMIS